MRASGWFPRRPPRKRSARGTTRSSPSPTGMVCGSAAPRASTSIRMRPACRRSPIKTPTRPAPAHESVIDPLDEPFVAGDVVKQLAQQVAVEHDLPVLAHDRLSPPLGLDLPAGDGI